MQTALETLLTDDRPIIGVSQDSCGPEGSIQLSVNDTQESTDGNNQTYQLLQVCLFGHWSYVCGNGFHNNNADRMVALYQLGCTKGGW